MPRKIVYLIFALIGLIVPYYFLISFLMAHGLDARLFLKQLLGTPISTFFAVDLMISSLVFLPFLKQEADRHSVKHSWVYVLALFTVGLSFALPLFLWARESRLQSP